MEAQHTQTILALDASSTSIGWLILDGDDIRDRGTAILTGTDIADRCRQAFAHLGGVLFAHPDIDLIAVESPVARFAKALIPQARVSGALMAAAMLKRLPVVEISPAEAKQALTGKGDADKAAMMDAAGLTNEHQADAYGIALAARNIEAVRLTRATKKAAQRVRRETKRAKQLQAVK